MWYLIVVYLLYGASAGLVNAPITITALSGMPEDQSGAAGAIASTCRQAGAAVGVAVTGGSSPPALPDSSTPATPRGRWSPVAAS